MKDFFAHAGETFHRAAALIAIGGFIILPAYAERIANINGIGYIVYPYSLEHIDEHGVCKDVANSGHRKVFIPVKYYSEWNAFIGAAQAGRVPGVTISDCGGESSSSDSGGGDSSSSSDSSSSDSGGGDSSSSSSDSGGGDSSSSSDSGGGDSSSSSSSDSGGGDSSSSSSDSGGGDSSSSSSDSGGGDSSSSSSDSGGGDSSSSSDSGGGDSSSSSDSGGGDSSSSSDSGGGDSSSSSDSGGGDSSSSGGGECPDVDICSGSGVNYGGDDGYGNPICEVVDTMCSETFCPSAGETCGCAEESCESW